MADRVLLAASELRQEDPTLSSKLSRVHEAAFAEPIDEAALDTEEAVLSSARSVRLALLEKNLLDQDPHDDAALAAALARATVGYTPQF
jgi:hypothetical protein